MIGVSYSLREKIAPKSSTHAEKKATYNPKELLTSGNPYGSFGKKKIPVRIIEYKPLINAMTLECFLNASVISTVQAKIGIRKYAIADTFKNFKESYLPQVPAKSPSSNNV